MAAYYNEHDKYAAQWLRNLIKAGHIADGVVDERSIEDVQPADLRWFKQCHFFAGIGVWSHALRSAGWPDDRSVWTGSCPCQPFSAAGKGSGFADERHLWPHFHWLIQERRPAVVFGEQVASADTGPWIDLVQNDMEGLGYAFGAVPFPAASVGAPHIRDRLYWVADSERSDRGCETATTDHREQKTDRSADRTGRRCGASGGVGHTDSEFVRRRPGASDSAQASPGDRPHGDAAVSAGRDGWLADTNGRDASAEREQRSGEQRQQPQNSSSCRLADTTSEGRGRERSDGNAGNVVKTLRAGKQEEPGRGGATDGAGPLHGFWAAADWLLCRDGRWRPVEPGAFPLAHGAAGRVGRLRAYGNAIVAPQAEAFIRAVM